MSNTSTILLQQQSHILDLNNTASANIETEINNLKLNVYNFSIGDFQNLKLITNVPQNHNFYLILNKIEVFINNNLAPTPVYGLLDLLKAQINQKNLDNYKSDNKSFKPFKDDNFKDDTTITELFTKLMNLSPDCPAYSSNDTYKLNLQFTLS
jgi:hypothetical protein